VKQGTRLSPSRESRGVKRWILQTRNNRSTTTNEGFTSRSPSLVTHRGADSRATMRMNASSADERTRQELVDEIGTHPSGPCRPLARSPCLSHSELHRASRVAVRALSRVGTPTRTGKSLVFPRATCSPHEQPTTPRGCCVRAGSKHTPRRGNSTAKPEMLSTASASRRREVRVFHNLSPACGEPGCTFFT